MSQVKEQVREFIVENFLFGDDADFNEDASFLEEGIIDSTGVLELVTFLEETFSITVDDEELVPENLDSLTNVINYIDVKLNGAKG